MNSPLIKVWLSFSNEAQSFNEDINSILERLPQPTSFYQKDEERILANGKIQSFPNRETVIEFAKFYSTTNLEEINNDLLSQFAEFVPEFEILSSEYGYECHLCYEFSLKVNPFVSLSAKFIDFLSRIKCSITMDIYPE